MDSETFKTVLETIERLAYRAGAAEAERHTVLTGPITATSGDVTIPAIAQAEHPTLAKLRVVVLLEANENLIPESVAVWGRDITDSVTWGELRAWAKEGGEV
jgi:hypothetical protein